MVANAYQRMKEQATQKPIDRVLSRMPDAKPVTQGKAGWYSAKCPGHNDKSASLSFIETTNGGVAFKCHAGCATVAILEGMGISEHDVAPVKGYRRPAGPMPTSLDLVTLAADKLLPWQFLFNQGVIGDHPYNGKLAVRIPYYTEDGTEYSKVRIRTAVRAKEGSTWAGDDKPLIPYGLHKLEMARKDRYLWIGEGESDAWTCWLHGIPYLGVPGASNVGCLNGRDLNDIPCVFIIQEPDGAGRTFASGVLQQLKKTRYKGKIYTVDFKKATGHKDPNELHKHLMLTDKTTVKAVFNAAISKAIENIIQTTKPVERTQPQRLGDLQQETLPDTRWIIPDILPEGLTLLVGKPKLGKSWLLLAAQTAVSSGQVALGNIPVEQGEVLYISLEDNKRRLQKRSNIVLQNARASEDFYYATSWPRLGEGGIEELEEWIDEHPRVRLIGIDTWARFKPKSTGGISKQQYDEDYDALTPLQELASRKHIAIVVVHHMRKQESDDPLDMISGSAAMQGAVDGFLLLYRKRQETDARLFVLGRDIEQEQELLLQFKQECASWVIKGDAESDPVAATPQRQAILDVLKQCPDGLPLKELHKHFGDKSINTLRNLLVKLRNENKVDLSNNIWFVEGIS